MPLSARRSMSAALQTVEDLTPAAIAFIKEGTPKPRIEKQESVNPSAVGDPPLERASSESHRAEIAPEEIIPRRRTEGRREDFAIPVDVMVGLSFRVPVELQQGLLRMSSDRKLKRQKPWTQQEIAAEALAAWLKKQGYL
jgi:hypothetical protein